MIDRVVIAADFFRGPTNQSGSISSHINLLYRLISPAIRRLGVSLIAVYPVDVGGIVNTEQIMRGLGLPCSPAGWAAATNCDISPELLRPFLDHLTPSTLVVGWEMPKSIVRVIETHNIPILDLGISPLRFSNDLFFSIRANDNRINRILELSSTDEEYFWQSSGSLRAKISWRMAGCPEKRQVGILNNPSNKYGLFIGQTKIDQSLIENGFIRSPDKYIAQISDVFSEVDTILVAAHPYEADREHLYPIVDTIHNSYFTEENVYRLMCSDNVVKIASLSSGVLAEAPYFFKDYARLICPDRESIFSKPESLMMNKIKHIDASFFDTCFWRSVLFDEPISAYKYKNKFCIADIFGMKWGRDFI